MKIRIADKDEISDEEIEECKLREQMGLVKEATDEQMAEHLSQMKEVVISQQVADFLKEQGMTPDDLVAMMLKQAKREN